MTENTLMVPTVQMTLGAIEIANFEQLKQAVDSVAERSSNLVVTADEAILKTAKDEKAKLNKLVKAIDGERIKIKKEYMKPLENFENNVKNIKKKAEKTINILTSNINEVEELQKIERKKVIDGYIENLSEGYPIEFDPRWLNKTAKKMDILEDIQAQVKRHKAVEAEKEANIKTIETMAMAWGFESDGWVAMLDLGRTVHEIVEDIKNTKKRSLQAEEDNVEEPQTEEIQTPQGAPEPPKTAYVEPIKQAPLETITLKLTGTRAQMHALKQFIQTSGITYERI